MADEVVGLRIEVDSNVGEAVGSLRSQLKAAQAEVAAMAEKFGETSVEAANAAKKAAELKDRIGDAKALTDAFSPDAKFKALTAALSGVAGGFAAVQGAMGLLGSENKELEKSLLKVQSAMALAQGLDQVTESIDSFKNLKAVIQDSTVYIKLNELANKAAAGSMKLFGVAVETTSTSFKVLKGAIAATGIGLLIVGIGELVSAFQNYTSEAEKAKEAQDKLNESIKKGADVGLQAELQYIDNEERLAIARAKNRNASEKELFEIEQSYRKLRANSQLRYWKEIKDIDVEGAMKAKAEIAKINADGQVAQLNFDTEEKKRRDERNKARLEKEKEHRQDITNLLKSYNDTNKGFQQDELSSYIDTTDQIMQTKLDENQQVLEAQLLTNQTLSDSDAQRLNDELVNAETRKRIAKEEADYKIEQAQRAAGLLNDISNLIGKQTAAGKAAAVASTIINTYAAAQLAFKNAQLNPISILGSAYPYIQAGFAIAAGVKNVQQILSVPVPNGGGGGGGSVPSGGGYSFSSGGTAPISPQTNVVTTQLTNQNLNELKNNTVKAYVVESEMTDSQTRIRRIQQAAEFGD